MVRRYEPMDDEGYGDYARYRAPRDGGGTVNRYEVGRQSLQSLQSSVKAKRLSVFTNGDRPTKGDRFSKGDKHQIPPVQIIFSKKKYPQLFPLFEEITRLTKRKVTKLFKWPSGQEVCNVTEIEDEDESNMYVCSNERSLVQSIPYGGIQLGGSPFTEKYSRTSHDSRGTLRSEKSSPKAVRSHASSSKVPPVTIVVTSNTVRDCTSSLIIDTRSHREFEKILENIEDMIEAEDMPITALYSKERPYTKVDSYSSLNMVLRKYGNQFWACGSDGPPIEKKSGSSDTSPMRNGYQQRQKHSYKQNGHNDYRGRQSNGYSRQPETYEDPHGRSYQRHQQDDTDDQEQDETDQELSTPPAPKGSRRADPSPRRNSKQAVNRQSQRRSEGDYSPQRDSRQVGNRQSQRRDEEDDTECREHQDPREQQGRQKQKRQQTPPRKDYNNREEKDEDENKEEDDDDDDERERNHPSEEEMQRRIEAMERPDSKLDKDIHY